MRLSSLISMAVFMASFHASAQNALLIELRKTAPFHAVYARDGIDVFIRQGEVAEVKVEDIERHIGYLTTKVVENVLYIYYDDRLKGVRNKRGRVFVSVADLAGIKASGGADVIGETVFEVKSLELIASGGSDIKMAVRTASLTAKCTGGADIVLEGQADLFEASASGGSHISAHELKVRKADLEASGGADIHISIVEELKAEAHGGADISYKGRPEKVYTVEKGGGDVRRRN